MEPNRSFKSISLFSGAFGLDLGLEAAGIDNVLAIDYDKDCVDTLKMNAVNAIQGDIKEILDSDPTCNSLLRLARIKSRELFLISGGPPCQSYSTAGKRGLDTDPRGSLIYDFVTIIVALRPRFFALENVRGLLSAYTFDRYGKKELVVSVLKERFEKSGYKIIAGLIDTVNYGVPQHRDRVVILGSRDNEDIFLPEPTHFQIHQRHDLRWKTLGSAIRDIEREPGPYIPFSPGRKKIMQLIPSGGNWRNLPDKIKKAAMGGALDAQGGRTSFYRRLDYNMPSPTLTTAPGQRATTLCHPTQDRPLSVNEYVRIQQFPDDWRFSGSLTSIYRQLGNAVPVNFGKAIGEMFVSVANNSHSILSRKRSYSERIFELS